ncbi:DUF4407 domain-containing protein [Neptunitalea lumnitzerae]|uniref:DUF4407 domain-containing protein n=1 Tax=Neptunitalea lumnitzerae TaxID=2965509 RepID=A0ABQ5MEX1_9FLAO|nr:DUF4407 domain-containing protein [Neptunitalea sp. Y10]GLB47931.1 hypothetical protein Y10_02990 [Neptunitalea sp. Y10]
MIQKFFILCSGADTQILDTCSNGEKNKYAGMGATVFFTALMAWIAGSYALYTIFDNAYTSGFFGLIWGLLIFNLDRYIVGTMRKKDSKLNEMVQAIPRIVLAIIIAIVISKPLELKIFQKEIDAVLQEERNQKLIDNKSQITSYYQNDINHLNQEIDNLKKEITTKESEVNNLYKTYIEEAEGLSGTKKLGKGPVYEEKRQKHDAALLELQTLKQTNLEKIDKKEAEIAVVQDQLEQQLSDTNPIIKNFDGLMARINALGKLPWLPVLFITLLFLTIETAPVIIKLLASKGEYDAKLTDLEETQIGWLGQKAYQRTKQQETDKDLNNRIYEDLKSDEALYSEKKEKAAEIAKLQAEAFYKQQKSVL